MFLKAGREVTSGKRGQQGGLIFPRVCPATFPRSSRFVLSQPREESVSEREVWFSPAARWGTVWGVTRGG